MRNAANYILKPAGLFLISIGFALFAAMAFADVRHPYANQNVFLMGMGISFVVLFGIVFLQGLRARPLQRIAINGSIVLEMVLFIARPHVTGPLTPAGNWIAALLIVGIHFIPFAIALGFELALLGVCCILNASLAMTNWASPPIWLSIDAVLKIGFGVWICLRPSKPGSTRELRRSQSI